MSLGLVGRKVGMMRIFRDDGTSVPVTVIDCAGNRVAQIKTSDVDGYIAIQVAFGKRRASRVTKPIAGHLAKDDARRGQALRHAPRLGRRLELDLDVLEVRLAFLVCVEPDDLHDASLAAYPSR